MEKAIQFTIEEIAEYLKENGVDVIQTFSKGEGYNANRLTFAGDKDEGVRVWKLCSSQCFQTLNLEQVYGYRCEQWQKPYFRLYFS